MFSQVFILLVEIMPLGANFTMLEQSYEFIEFLSNRVKVVEIVTSLQDTIVILLKIVLA